MVQVTFSEWKKRTIHKNKLFISDGIIDKKRWGVGGIKPLFLLKEAYGSDGENDWDLCELVRDEWKGPRYSMWWRVSEWAFGLRNLASGSVAHYPEDDCSRTSALLASAVVNLKKSNGKSKSLDEDLATYVESDWDLIEKQILRIAPDIVVCGNTWELIKDRLDSPMKISDWVYSALGMYFVDYYHPANHYPAMLNYHAICSLVNQAGVLRK